MNVLQFNETISKYTPEIMDLLNAPEEEYYQPDLKVGDSVNVFNTEAIVVMTVEGIDGKEFTLSDHCGFRYLAEAWRWTEDLGVVLKTKTSMRSKKAAGWGTKCCKEAKRLSLKKVA